MKNPIRISSGLIIASLILIIASILISNCESERIQSATIKAMSDENSNYKLRNGQLVTSQNTAIVNQNQLKDQLKNKELELAKKFVQVKTFTKHLTFTKIDTINIVYRDSIPCTFERIGAIFKDEYNLAYKSTQKGITITQMAIPDSVIIATGYKRSWILGKKTLTMDITHSNPLIMSEQVQNFQVQEKKKFWQTDLFKIGTGILVGIGIAK